MRKVSTLKDVSMGNLGTACFQQTQPKCAVCMHIECITFVFSGETNAIEVVCMPVGNKKIGQGGG